MINIAALLRLPFEQLVKQIHEDIAKAGFPEVREAHGVVFVYIGKGARLTELADRAKMTKQSMSYLVEYLENYGYIQKSNDVSDKRAKIFSLTEKGHKINAIADQSMEKFERLCIESLGEKKYKQLVGLLRELDESIRS